MLEPFGEVGAYSCLQISSRAQFARIRKFYVETSSLRSVRGQHLTMPSSPLTCRVFACRSGGPGLLLTVTGWTYFAFACSKSELTMKYHNQPAAQSGGDTEH